MVTFVHTFQMVIKKKTNFLTHDLSTNHNSEDSMADIRRLLQIPKPSEDPTLGD